MSGDMWACVASGEPKMKTMRKIMYEFFVRMVRSAERAWTFTGVTTLGNRGGVWWTSVVKRDAIQVCGGASLQGCETWILSAEVIHVVGCVQACL